MFWNGFYKRKKAIFIQLLQEACPSGWSFARGRPLRMIICNHEKGMGLHFWDPSRWNKMCFEYQRIKFQWENGSEFSHLFTVRAEGADPNPPPLPLSPLTVSLTAKKRGFWRLKNQIGCAYTLDTQRYLWLCFLEHLFSMLGSKARQWTTPPVFVSFQMS